MRPEDAHSFITIALIEPVVECRKNKTYKKQATGFLKLILTELSQAAYSKYAALKYPQLFAEFDLLDKALSHVTDDDLIPFAQAHSDNLAELMEVCG